MGRGSSKLQRVFHRRILPSLVVGAMVSSSVAWADVQSAAEQGLTLNAGPTSTAEQASFEQDADRIRQTYESQLFTLPAFKMGHYGLRMYRQTQDPKYQAAIWSDMARVASRLNYFATEVNTPEQIAEYSAQRLARYEIKDDVRSDLRYEATKDQPEYYYLGVDLLGSMARANEYGLKHREDAKLREVIRRYDFEKYATDPEMIRRGRLNWPTRFIGCVS